MYKRPPIAPRYVNLQVHLSSDLPLRFVFGVAISAYDRPNAFCRVDFGEEDLI